MSATPPGEPRYSLPTQPDRHGVRDDFATRSRLPHVCCCVRRWLRWIPPSPLLPLKQRRVLTSSQPKHVAVAAGSVRCGNGFVLSSGSWNLVAAAPHSVSPGTVDRAGKLTTQQRHRHCAKKRKYTHNCDDQTTSFLFPAQQNVGFRPEHCFVHSQLFAGEAPQYSRGPPDFLIIVTDNKSSMHKTVSRPMSQLNGTRIFPKLI